MQKVYSSKDTNDLLKLILFNKKLFITGTVTEHPPFLDSNRTINLMQYPYLIEFDCTKISTKVNPCYDKLSCKNNNLIQFQTFKIYNNDTAYIVCQINESIGAIFNCYKINNVWKIKSETFGII